ncbi:TLR2 [Branchiostoma lanceolatum]|uniref:TLR2 protein n=1 Tax=Branchiostoma lanceolatum TaxID=7740 RepID=A0A8K0A812_BRALA|nr:TLR2 [Branchiostoma lanceolatum]
MSKLSSTRHCSTVVEVANVSPDSSKVADPNALQHLPALGQSRGDGELEIDSPAGSEDHDTDSDRQDGKVGVAPPLGEREKYHVFFCYSSADAPWVKDIIQTLESDKFGFKCCIHKRDFTPGASVFENISRSIQESQKTVFVLSRDFVESRWCDFERQLVMSENLREKNRKVIPVMLHKCDLLPDFLRHMTYLEEWTPYFFNRFIGALKDEADSKLDPFSTFTYNPNYINGQHVLKMEPQSTWEEPCCRFDDQILSAELMSRGIRVRREDAVAVIEALMMTGKMAHFNWYYTKLGPLVMFGKTLLFITCIAILASLNGMFSHEGDSSGFRKALVVMAFPGAPIGVAIHYFTGRYMLNKTMARAMVEVNTILAKYHILATVTDKYLGIAKAVLQFVYYERGSCLLQIQEDLMAMSTQDSSSVDGNSKDNFADPVVSSSALCVELPCTDPLLSDESGDEPATDIHKNRSSSTSDVSQFRAEADALLLKYSDQYVRLLVNSKLPRPRLSSGHTQQDPDACLCQLVEIYEFGWKLDCVWVEGRNWDK